VLACLAKQREERPRHATDLLERLDRCRASIGPWSEAEARAWWGRWAPAARRPRPPETALATTKTDLRVDLADRR
jgi:hypothetical protein